MTAIAIVGIECRFPGGPDRDSFWSSLLDGVDGTSDIPSSRWDVDGVYSPQGTPGTVNCRRAGLLDDLDAFDPAVFAIGDDEAALLDPQQRLTLQCAWRAMEDAGLDPRRSARDRVGVYVGVMGNDWDRHADTADAITPKLGTGIGYAMIPNRVSYQLNLTGPSVAVDTWCSSALVAVHTACGALTLGDCDYAVAGGANALLTPKLGIFLTQVGVSAPDGRCKPFSAAADGVGRSEGVGLVVLRRLDDAVADGQRIYAVLRGGAVNHVGRGNGITAPNRWGQQDVITRAYRQAGIAPEDLSFVEAHGTGTRMGDLVEVCALGDVHGVERAEPCLIGSVKGNVGHPEGAAGAASLIKAALALYHRVVPPTVGATPVNPDLDLAARGLRLVTETTPLPASGTVYGAVSGFGLTGTNAHLVLESAPPPVERASTAGPWVFTVSAADGDSLRRNLAAQERYLATQPPHRIGALCYTSNRVKSSLRRRYAVVVDGAAQLLASLRETIGAMSADGGAPSRPVRARIGFLFPGATRGGDGTDVDVRDRALYRSCPAFAALADQAGAADTPEKRLFQTQVLLGRLLDELGVRPAAVTGWGVGELAAACTAGSVSAKDAAELVEAWDTGPANLAATAARLTWNAVRIPVFSGRLGRPLRGEWGTEEHWVDEAPSAVALVRAALRTSPTHLVHIGPEPLTADVCEEAGVPATTRVLHASAEGGLRPLAELAVALYVDGVDVRWDALYPPGQQVVGGLPGYVFSTARRFPIQVPGLRRAQP